MEKEGQQDNRAAILLLWIHPAMELSRVPRFVKFALSGTKARGATQATHMIEFDFGKVIVCSLVEN